MRLLTYLKHTSLVVRDRCQLILSRYARVYLSGEFAKRVGFGSAWAVDTPPRATPSFGRLLH